MDEALKKSGEYPNIAITPGTHNHAATGEEVEINQPGAKTEDKPSYIEVYSEVLYLLSRFNEAIESADDKRTEWNQTQYFAHAIMKAAGYVA